MNIVPLPELPPPVGLYEPQLVPNAEMFAAEIMRMVEESLAEQGRRSLSAEAQEIYQERLLAAAQQPPAPEQSRLAERHNERTQDDSLRIDLDGKTRLEAAHDLLRHLDRDERDGLCAATAQVLERKAAQRAAAQEAELSEGRGFSLSR